MSASSVVALADLRSHHRVAVRNVTRSSTLAATLTLALDPWTRLRGLLGRRLGQGEGLLLRPCNGVHTFFMSYPIDVIFVDEAATVVAVRPDLRPWRATPVFAAARATIEVAAGGIAASGTGVGDHLAFESDR